MFEPFSNRKHPSHENRKIFSTVAIEMFVENDIDEMTKITNSIQSHKSYRKNKSENGRTWTSEYIRGGIRCLGGISIPCRPVTPAVSHFSRYD
jgi:hypothetical protein